MWVSVDLNNKLSNEISFGLDIWHAGSSEHCIGRSSHDKFRISGMSVVDRLKSKGKVKKQLRRH